MNNAQSRFAGIASPLEGVSAQSWARFAAALEVQPIHIVSDSGGLGAYDIRPRRLVELGYANGLRSMRRETAEGKRRQIQVCDFIMPWTEARFLKNLIAQHTVLAKSMRGYYDALNRGDIAKPKDVSLAGALAILHIGGLGALRGWPDLFDNTRAVYERAQGEF